MVPFFVACATQNPVTSIVNGSTILFAISSDDDAVDICAHDGEADKRTWQGLFGKNRRTRKASMQLGAEVEDVGNTGWLQRTLDFLAKPEEHKHLHDNSEHISSPANRLAHRYVPKISE